MWELDCEEGWAPKNWCFWTVVLEKSLKSPLDFKEIQPVHGRDQPWDFFGRADAKAETPVLWPPHAKSWLIGKDPDAGRDWGQEEKGTTEDELAGWHHPLDGHEFEWTAGIGDGQGGLARCNSWGCKESDTTEQLNWTELSSKSAHYFPGEKHYFVILIRKQKYILCSRRRYSIFQGCSANSLEINNLKIYIKVSSQDFQKCKISIKDCLSRLPWHPVVGTLFFCVGLVPFGKNPKCFIAKKPKW